MYLYFFHLNTLKILFIGLNCIKGSKALYLYIFPLYVRFMSVVNRPISISQKFWCISNRPYTYFSSLVILNMPILDHIFQCKSYFIYTIFSGKSYFIFIKIILYFQIYQWHHCPPPPDTNPLIPLLAVTALGLFDVQ